MAEHRMPTGETNRQRAQRARRAREKILPSGPHRTSRRKKADPVEPVAPEQAENRRVEALRRELAVAKRMLVAKRSHDDFLTFVKFTMPDHENPDDVDRSRYTAARHHQAIAAALEEVERGAIKRLIVTLPPRHGKTELITKRFIPWLIGKDPTRHVVAATYSDTFALDFGREIRQTMKSSQFEQVFKGKGSHVIKGEAAADRLRFTAGGQLVTVGRGGALTGRGANCFPGETLVETRHGPRRISRLTVADEVLSYDTRTGKLVWKAVQAVARRPRSGLLRITTASGRVVEATRDHRFYAGGEWREARQLAPGDRLVRAVRGDGGKAGVRDNEAREARTGEFLLLPGVLGTGGERPAFRGAKVHEVRGARAQEGRPLRIREDGSHLLLDGLHGSGAGRGVRHARHVEDEAMRALQCDVPAAELEVEVLLEGVLVTRPRAADGEGREPTVEGWRLRQQSEAACDEEVPGTAPLGLAAGWREVRPVLKCGRAGGSPHRREPAEQSSVEFGDRLSAMSPTGPLWTGEDDFVVSVEDARREADVYDIQVEGTHCFFAEGILVHNCLIIDDLLKDAEEAGSPTIREKAWEWFTRVAMTRLMTQDATVVIVMTRWHSDDIVGRLTDPTNAFYDPEEAAQWKVINLPALAGLDDPLGRAPGEALWPERFPVAWLEGQRRLDPAGFSALYQQRPTPEEGEFFKADWIATYVPQELPEGLSIYIASDHAVGVDKKKHDRTVWVVAGVDTDGSLWVLDAWIGRETTEKIVELMIDAMMKWKPIFWFAEKGHITSSIGPFLRRRMQERRVWVAIEDATPVKNKVQRAQSIQAMMSAGRVKFPRYAHFLDQMKHELLTFPRGNHDDIVDALAWLGVKLQRQVTGSGQHSSNVVTPRVGTLAWIKWDSNYRSGRLQAANGGGFKAS